MSGDRKKAQEEAKKVQDAITEGWKAVNADLPFLIEDFVKYTEGLAHFYRYCAEEQEMHGVPLNDHQISSLLQQARVCDTVRTYITSRIDQDVAQSIKSK